MTRRRALLLALAVCLLPGLAGAGDALTGRVLDGQGRPLAGVELWRMGRAERPATVTDADGMFAIPNPALVEHLMVCPAGWVYRDFRNYPPPPGPVEIRLQPSARLSGRVVDGRGEPVPGIDVTAQFAGWTPGNMFDFPEPPCPGHPRYRRESTDADGRFAFEDMEPGWYDISIAGGEPGRMEPWQAVAGAPAREREITLAGKLVSLEGRVMDADGQPVSGADVIVRDRMPALQVRTDADGIFRFPDVLPGSHPLRVSHPDLGWIEMEVRIAEPRASVDIRMPAPTRIEGRVVGRNGSPVDAPRVSVDSVGLLAIDDEGRFGLVVAPGEHRLRADADDRISMETTFTAAGERMELAVELSRPATVRGRIAGLSRGERGTALLTGGSGEWGGQAVADEAGRFSISGVAPGDWTLAARDPNGRTVERRIRVEEGREVTVEDFRFSPLPEIRGRVLDPEGRPLESVTLQLFTDDVRVWDKSDAQGSFATHLADETWTVMAEKQGFGSASATFTVKGSPMELPTLRLPRAVAVSGHLRGLAPGEVARVEAKSEDGLWRRGTYADQESRFTIRDLQPGTWTLTARFENRDASIQVRILPGDTAVRADIAFE